MSKLNIVQQQFTDALLEQEKQNNLLDFVKSDYANQRLNIYRQTIIQNLRQALEITYPGIWVLLGKECADSAAYVFCQDQKNLPLSGNLDEWGENFPIFLENQPEFQGLPYLKDFGRYEWLKQLAYGQPDRKHITYNDLNNLSEKTLEQSKLILHPSVYLMESKFPLDKILELVENFDISGFELKNYKTYALISRVENCVMTYWITEDNFLFFQNVLNRLTLAECLENTEKKYPHFNITETIGFLMSCKLISTITYA